MKKIISLTILTLVLCTFMSMSAFADANVPVTDGDVCVYADGEEINFEDVNAQIVNGSAFIPLRAVFEKLGASVMWIEDNSTIIASYGENKLISQIGNTTVFFNNDKTVELENAPFIVNNRTLISCDVLTDFFDVNVQFGEDLSINIKTSNDK